MPSLIIKFILLNSGRKVPEIKPDTEMLPVISAAGLRWVRLVDCEVWATKGSIISPYLKKKKFLPLE